jgi:hypothetical protein
MLMSAPKASSHYEGSFALPVDVMAVHEAVAPALPSRAETRRSRA